MILGINDINRLNVQSIVPVCIRELVCDIKILFKMDWKPLLLLSSQNYKLF